MEFNYQVYIEKSFSAPNSPGAIMRPDIVAIKDTQALVIDISVVYEVTDAGFRSAYQRKVDKYQPISSLIMKSSIAIG